MPNKEGAGSQSEGVELRFFGGLSVAAEALHISPETVVRDWNVAKVWLRELDGGASHVV